MHESPNGENWHRLSISNREAKCTPQFCRESRCADVRTITYECGTLSCQIRQCPFWKCQRFSFESEGCPMGTFAQLKKI